LTHQNYSSKIIRAKNMPPFFQKSADNARRISAPGRRIDELPAAG
jgi:hypothetical protein